MADSDDSLSRRYRELAREEPRACVDEAILAASRRAVSSRPRNLWIRALSIAAVLVLGIGLSMRMLLEEPGIETAAPQASSSAEYPVPQAAETTPPVQPAPRAKISKPAPATPQPAAAPPPATAAPSEPPSAMTAPPAADSAPLRMKREAMAAPAPAATESVAAARDAREVELERIARLRSEGQHDQADKALEEFRRRHPEYRIPEAMWERVRPR